MEFWRRTGPPHSSQNFACGRFSCWHRGQCISDVSRFRLAAGHDHASPDPAAAAGTWRPGRPRGATTVQTLPDWRPQAPAGLLRPGSRSVGGSTTLWRWAADAAGRCRRGPDDPGHLLERLRREDRPHLLVAGLVPADAGLDGPGLSRPVFIWQYPSSAHRLATATAALRATHASSPPAEAAAGPGGDRREAPRHDTPVCQLE